MKKSILVILYIFLTILGLVLMKFGGNTGSIEFVSSSFNFSISIISLMGFVAYIVSFFLFTNIVVKFDLSYIVPISSGLVQVFTLISGFTIFKENITIKGIVGALFVIAGIVIMNIKREESKGIKKGKI